MAQHYRCNICKGEFGAKSVEVDHISEVVSPATGFVSWDEYIKRLFCSKENLQVVCRPCHKLKTSLERKARKEK